MKKQLNTEAISNELRGASLFFVPLHKQEPEQTTPLARPALPIPVVASGVRTPRRPDAPVPRGPEPATPGHQDTRLDLTVKAEVRQTLRLTDGEFRRLGFLQGTLSERLGVIRVDKNDIIRSALHRMFQELEQAGAETDLIKRLRRKYR